MLVFLRFMYASHGLVCWSCFLSSLDLLATIVVIIPNVVCYVLWYHLLALDSKSAFVLSWFVVMVLFGYILFVCFQFDVGWWISWAVGACWPGCWRCLSVPVRPSLYYVYILFPYWWCMPCWGWMDGFHGTFLDCQVGSFDLVRWIGVMHWVLS